MFFKKRQQEFRSMLTEYDILRAEIAKYDNYSYRAYQLKWLTYEVTALCLIVLGGVPITLTAWFNDSLKASPNLAVLSYTMSFIGMCMIFAAPMLLAFCDSSSLSFLLWCDFDFLEKQIDSLQSKVNSLHGLASTNS